MSMDQRVEALDREGEAAASAELLVTSEPWLTLGLSRETAHALLTNPEKEVHAVRDARGVAGFVVIDMNYS